MGNWNLSDKIKYIKKELNLDTNNFIKKTNLSKPTVYELLNRDCHSRPSISTIDSIVKLCQESNNLKLQGISYDYLLNDNINNINNENIIINKYLNLSDRTIEILKENKNIDIINFFIENSNNDKYWKLLKYLKITIELINKTKIMMKTNQKNLRTKCVELSYFLVKENSEFKDYILENYKKIFEQIKFDKFLPIMNEHEKYNEKSLNEIYVELRALQSLFETILKDLKYKLNEENLLLYNLMEQNEKIY